MANVPAMRAGPGSGGEEPSVSYTPLLAVYAGGLAVAAGALRLTRRRLPDPKVTDVLLMGAATFKLSRLVTKDKVLQPVRRPFVARTEPAEGPEVNSEPAGTGIRRAVGELLTCPFCMSVWIASALTVGYVVAPRATRIVAAGLTEMAVADGAQYAYAQLRS
jgi:Protein of unknown function (DUF1360)